MMRPTAGKSGLSEHRTPSMHDDPSDQTDPQKPPQFDMQSLLWLVATISIALVYLRSSGQRAALEAVVIITLAAAVAVLVGTMQGKIGPVLYWSVLGAAFAFVSTAHGGLAHWTTPFAWAGVGMVTGCTAGSLSDTHWPRCVAGSGLAAGVVMSIYCAFLFRFTGEFDWFDLAMSAPIGAFFGLLVAILRQVQRRSMLRYDALATLLMAAIVAGNYLSRFVAPFAILAVTLTCIPGCGKSAPTADPVPFEAAVEQYLAKNDMALRLKEIRQGPTISGDSATMSASMTHKELGGPSVVWTFQFQRAQPGGTAWNVASHSDK